MALVGREREVAACRGALRRGLGAAAVIVGEPGIGKTTLFREVIGEAAVDHRLVLSTTGLRGGIDMSLANVVDLLDPAVREVLSSLPSRHADALRVVLGLSPPADELDDFLIARAMVNALRALTVTAGRILVGVDDVQWLDPDSDRLLSVLLTWTTDLPVGWLLAVRAGHDDDGLVKTAVHELDQQAVRIEVVGLDRATLYELITERFPGPWSATLLRRITDLSAGNPYAALELARGTLAAGCHDARHASVPASLADSLRRRLSRLSADALTVVHAAAVTARPTRPLIRAILGTGVDDSVDEALDAGVLHTGSRDAWLTFTHPLLQEVTVSTIRAAERRRLHLSWARVIVDPVEAAGHLSAGTVEPDEDVAMAVEAAAERLIARGAIARAAAFIESALVLTPDQSGRSAWRRRMTILRCLERADEGARARVLADQWHAAGPPDDLRGSLTFFRGLLALQARDYATGFALLGQAVDEAPDPAEQADIGACLACNLALSWRFEEAILHAERAIRAAERACAVEQLRWARAVRAEIADRTGDTAAPAMLAAAFDLPGGPGGWMPVFSPEMSLALRHVGRGEMAPARPLLGALLDATERGGGQGNIVLVKLVLMIAEWYAGRWEEMEIHAVAVRQYSFASAATGMFAGALAEALLTAGRQPDPRPPDRLMKAIDDFDARAEIATVAVLRGLAAHVELSKDHPMEAVAWFDPVADQTRENAFADVLLVTIEGDYIEALARIGRADEAVTRLSWLQRKADQLEHPLASIASERAAAVLHLARGEPTFATAVIQSAVARARELGLPLELGRCLLVLGTAQRRSRQRLAATRTLDEAISIFHEMNALNWAARARSERARLVHAAKTLLTPAEQRIAELAAQGRTNAEIAAAVMLTVKTVEANLTRIYRKLDVRNRGDLIRRGTT